MADRQETGRPETLGHRLLRLGKVLAALAAGIGVYALGQVVGEQPADKDFWAGVGAFAGVLAILNPGAFYGWDAPRWWFSGARPAPSSAYLWSSRITGMVLLAGAVLAVLFLSEPDPPAIPGLNP